MRCNQRGCECTTCMECGRDHEDCVCALRERTEALLSKAENIEDLEGFVDSAIELLMDWKNK